jgi:hypothetical protein
VTRAHLHAALGAGSSLAAVLLGEALPPQHWPVPFATSAGLFTGWLLWPLIEE